MFNKLTCMMVFMLIGQLFYAQNREVPLWEGTIPGEVRNTAYQEHREFKDSTLVRTGNVSVPTLTIFLPTEELHTGTSVVICPGGGYTHLAIHKEGTKVAQWLNSLGITAFVLKYRLPSDQIMEDKTIGPLQDAQEAMRWVRRNADQWNLDKNKIGILGFSAGGHLASTLSTHFADNVYISDSTSARPDFSILIYPVISMNEEITHMGSRNNLLGKDPSEELIRKFSNEDQVSNLTPPTFIIHASDDKAVPVENSIQYYRQLKMHNVPVEMHIYEKGGHGFGLGRENTSKAWTKQCALWLKAHQY